LAQIDFRTRRLPAGKAVLIELRDSLHALASRVTQMSLNKVKGLGGRGERLRRRERMTHNHQ
jgi:hypothetical protein